MVILLSPVMWRSRNADMFALKYNTGILWDYYYNGSNNCIDVTFLWILMMIPEMFSDWQSKWNRSFDQMATIKLNSNGVEQWVRYGVAGAGESQGNCIAADDSRMFMLPVILMVFQLRKIGWS